MTTVLVTGANGQLGKCFQDISKKENHIEWFFKDSKSLDITDKKDIENVFLKQKFDYVINCAAYTAVDKAEKEINKAFEINALGPKNLAKACKNHNVVLIHISTDFVFDGTKTEPYSETDIANPISVYGESKLQGEIEVQNKLTEYFIIRTSWLYSEHGNSFMKTMLRLAETRDEISVVSDQIGTPTYAADLAEVVIHIIKIKSQSYGIYHYSNTGEISWYDFAKAIFDETNTEIKVNSINTKDYPTPAKRPVYSVMDKLKIKNILGVQIPFWEESLKKALENIN